VAGAPEGALRHFDALRFLLDAGDAVGSSLDYETTLTTVARQAVPVLADWCAVDLLDEAGRLRRLAVAHPDPAKVALAYELQQRYPEDPQSPYGAYARLRERNTLHMADIPDALLEESAIDAEHLRLLKELGLRSFIAAPLIARDQVMGVLTLVSAESGRRYNPSDVRIAEELARRAALAIDHAKIHHATVQQATQLEQQAIELELQAQQLQDQALEMEAQQSELEMQTEELRSANEELQIANESTARAEAFIRSITTSVPDALVAYDANWRCHFANTKAVAVFASSGYTGSFVGEVLWEEFPDLVGTSFEHQLRRAAAARETVMFTEYRAATAAWSEVRCSPLDDGGLVVTWSDVTEQRRADEALHFLARANEILVSSLDYESTITELAQLVVPRLADWCGVDLVDEAGRLQQLAVAHVDPQKVEWARELNRRYPPDPNAPTGAPNVIRTGRAEMYPDISDEMLVASAVDEEHLRIARGLGFTGAIVVPLQTRGRTLGAMTLVSAESGRRYTDAELRLAQELANRAAIAVDNASLYKQAVAARDAAHTARVVAEGANAAKSAFLAQMSHELRTPLNAIDGYASLLELGVRGRLTDEQLADIARIRRSQRHLLSLINDVLNFAKIEAGRVQFDLKPVVLAQFLEGLAPLVEPLLRERAQVYTLDATEPTTTVIADSDKLQQILLNLLSNAIKFTPRGGAIRVSAQIEPDAAIIRVIDNGIGIPQEKLDEIFEPFVQLRTEPMTIREGTGLGLAISRDLARGMGGDLTVTSTVAEGSTFILRLPLAV